MSVITYRMPFGVQGDVSRPYAATVESQPFGAVAFPQYGLAAKVSAQKMVPVAAQSDVIYGFLVRPFPITGNVASDPLGASTPPTTGIANILRRGYFVAFVQLGQGSAALGSAVYLRGQNPSGGQVLGGVEGSTNGNNYQLTITTGGIAYFASPADGNQLAEVGFNI